MKASGALLLSLFCLCEAGTEVHLELSDTHFELTLDHHAPEHENPEPLSDTHLELSIDHHAPEHENPEPMQTTTPIPHDADGYGPYSIHLLVINKIHNSSDSRYSTEMAYRGILIGAMRRIEKAYNDFNFTYTENQDYGPSLQSVNGVFTNATAHTYWALWGSTTEGVPIYADVGIGCYIPRPNETVSLIFTIW